MTEVTMFGYPARLVLDLPGGPHDITNCVELVTTADMRADHTARTGFWINTTSLLNEIAVESRTRARVAETAHETAHDQPEHGL